MLSLDPDKNAEKFLEIKKNSFVDGKRTYANNMIIVQKMKDDGDWI